MHSNVRTAITLKLDQKTISPFLKLLQMGFQVEIPAGRTVKTLLCGDIGVEADYLEDRIQTILLDGKPVDDLNSAPVNDGTVLALSAALGGLVGVTLRRGSVLSSFRSSITYQEEEKAPESNGSVVIVIKLFNLLINELGPTFLEKGIIVKRNALQQILDDGRHALKSAGGRLVMDGEERGDAQPDIVDWPRVSEALDLKVSVCPA